MLFAWKMFTFVLSFVSAKLLFSWLLRTFGRCTHVYFIQFISEGTLLTPHSHTAVQYPIKLDQCCANICCEHLKTSDTVPCLLSLLTEHSHKSKPQSITNKETPNLWDPNPILRYRRGCKCTLNVPAFKKKKTKKKERKYSVCVQSGSESKPWDGV